MPFKPNISGDDITDLKKVAEWIDRADPHWSFNIPIAGVYFTSYNGSNIYGEAENAKQIKRMKWIVETAFRLYLITENEFKILMSGLPLSGRIKQDIDAAVKFDSEKPRVDLMPFDALEDVAKVFSFGAQKYGEHNWRKGMAWMRLFGATLRHLFAWSCGQDLDPETGLRHLSHAACNVLFLISYDQHKLGEDDRWAKPKDAKI